MHITRLKLRDYKRVSLNNIKAIDYRPNAVNQVILGTNGVGKSSVMYELSPLPADPSKYTKTGLKEITIQHDGKHYVLTSDFSDKHTHSFVVDGEEKNLGGTITVQRTLVKEHFRLNDELHDLSLGRTSFTAMKPVERKDWFLKLSQVNYTYALKVYDAIRIKLRDAAGALKRAKQRLVTETSSALSKETKDRLKSEVEDLHNLVQMLIENRSPVDQSITDAEYGLKTLKDKLEQDAQLLKRLVIRIQQTKGKDLNTLQDDKNDLESQLRSLQILSTEYASRYETVAELHAELVKAKLLSEANSSQEIQKLEESVKELFKSKTFAIASTNDPKLAASVLAHAATSLDGSIRTLSEYSHIEIDRERVVEMHRLRDESVRMRSEHVAIMEKVQGLVDHLEALKKGNHQECPNCKFTWIVGFDQERYDKATQSMALRGAAVQELTVTIDKLNDNLEEVEKKRNALAYIRSFIAESGVLQSMWEYMTNKSLWENPNEVQRFFNRYNEDLHKDMSIEDLKHQIQDKYKALDLVQKHSSHDFNSVTKEKEQLEEKIAQVTGQLSVVNQRLQSVNELLTLTRKAQTLQASVKEDIALYDESNKVILELKRRSLYNDMLRDFQSALATKEQALQKANNHYSLIESIEKDIKDLEFEEQSLKQLSKALSPSEGLIAEGVYGFMSLFVNQMNEVIRKIWTYPLVVMPCVVDDSGSLDLNYKFPVMIDREDNTIDDVSEGSSAILEVIDLAFKIAALKALHFDNYPFYLDEFGKTMDPAHKAATVTLINNLMQQDNFSQLFLISHDLVQYGALSHTEIMVVSDTNMGIPKHCVYNQHVTFS